MFYQIFTTMKKTTLTIVLTTVCFFTYCQIDSLYLGKVPPGNTPEVFDIDNSSGFFAADRIAISADGKEIIYSITTGGNWSNCKVKKYEYINSIWEGPTEIFTGRYHAPALSMDGNCLFLEAIYGDPQVNKSYRAIRSGAGWSNPVEDENYYSYYQELDSGNVYACLYRTGDGLSKRIITETDTFFQSIGKPASNTGGFYIAKDESYFIGQVSGDLRISYKKENGTWTNPKTLGSTINSPSADDFGAFVTADNKYLFFSRSAFPYPSGKMYWVKIDNLIDSLKSTNYVPYVKHAIPDLTDSVGKSFMYTLPDSMFMDDDGIETLTISARLYNGNELPAWLSFDGSKFTADPEEAGIFRISVIATDTAGASASDNFYLRINGVDGLNLHEITELEVYPNPAKDMIYLNCEELIKETADYEIVNLLGRVVTRGKLMQNSVQVNSLSEGIYVLKIRTSNNNYIARIVKE